MQRQFYSERADASREVLYRITKEADFVLVGGWAVHAYTGLQRSLDIDIAVDYGSVEYFRAYGMQKYGSMNVNYVIIDGITVDLFIPEFTDKDLPFPVSIILSNYVKIDNIKVVKKELLLLLKLWGYFSNDETKLNKDVIDVVSLLFYSNINLDEVKQYIKKYKLERRRTTDVMIEYLDKGFAFADFIIKGTEDYKAMAGDMKKRIKALFNY
jgi:hypothetical protein